MGFKRSPARRSWLLRAAAVCCGLLLAGLLLEAGLRLATAVVRDAPEIYLRRSGESPKISRRGPDGQPSRRVMVVGDSFTFGHGVEVRETYAMRLASLLRRDDPTLEVISLSRPGWNTRLEARVLPDYLEVFPADLVILGYCLNDAEPYDTGRMLALNPHLERRESVFAPMWLSKRSHLIRRLEAAAETLRLRPLLVAYYRSQYDAADWDRALGRLARISTESGAQPVLVIFPIFDSPLDWRYAYDDLHELVAEAGRRAGYSVLDLLPVYRQSGFGGRDLALVPYSDPHPSALAHRIAAGEIASFLASLDR